MFILYFTTQDRNTHLEHLEDDIINRGINLTRTLLTFKVNKKYVIRSKKKLHDFKCMIHRSSI